MNDKELQAAQILNSRELRPFWDRVDRLLKRANQDLRTHKDLAYLERVMALEEVKKLPLIMAAQAKGEQ